MLKVQDIQVKLATATEGKFIILEELNGWVKVQTVSSKKIWSTPFNRLNISKSYDDGSFDLSFGDNNSSPWD